MDILESFLIYIIIILFPILVYLFYVAYKKSISEVQRSFYLEAALFSSLFFGIYLFNMNINSCCYILTIIPLFISYLYKKNYISIIMSIILHAFLSNAEVFPNYLIITAFVLYYLLYIIYHNNNKSRNFFTNCFYMITLFILLLYLFNHKYLVDIYLFTKTLFMSILFYITVTVINIFIMKADEILNLYSIIKDIEHEKQVKISLFKITHEIKNPISVVKGYLDMFDVRDRDKSVKYISIINQEINRTLNLLSDFMQFTKINLEKEEVEINILLDDVKQIVNPLMESKNIKCKFKTEEDIYLYADYNRLKQVVINLIKNSIEACKKNGIISVTTFKDNEKLYIIVKDNGIGMTKEEMNNIFTPFHTTKDNGTGLGVCLSKEIVEAHKGKLIYSSIKNKETIAKIVLPLEN